MAYSSDGHQGSRKRRARILISPPAKRSGRLNSYAAVILPPAYDCFFRVLVIFVIFRAFVGFLHDIAPGAQRFGDAG
jgi:hypothetical protein